MSQKRLALLYTCQTTTILTVLRGPLGPIVQGSEKQQSDRNLDYDMRTR